MFFPSQYWHIVSMLCRWARHFPSNASLDSMCTQCVRLVQCAEMAARLYARRGVEMAHE